MRFGVARALGCLACCLVLSDRASGGSVEIRLRSEVQTKTAIVRVADVAVLEGGPEDLRRAIAELELANFDEEKVQAFEISAARLGFRLQLRGIDASRFNITGAERCRISNARPFPTTAAIRRAARAELEQHLPWQASDVEIRGIGLIRAIPVKLKDGEQPRLEAHLAPASSMLGRVRVLVDVVVGNRVARTAVTEFHVRLFQQVAVAVRPIAKGEPITDRNVKADRRAVDDPSRYSTFDADLLGRRARRDVAAGQPLAANDVESSAQSSPVVVKPRDSVKMVARIGNVKIIAVGQALQPGKVGEWIRVRNVSSQAIVRCRISKRGEVEVE